MASLEATIRRLTGATDEAVVSDADVADALAAHRVRVERVGVVWEHTVDGSGDRTYLRGRVPGWGRFEPTTQATATTNVVTVAESDGTAVVGNWTLEQDGTITFATDQVSVATAIVVSAYSYDVHAACAEVIDQLVGLVAGDYTVKLGDQTFHRGEGADRLRALADGFRRKQLPRVARMVRMDSVPSVRRGRR